MRALRLRQRALTRSFPIAPTPPSTLTPELQREVEEIARRQEDELRRQIAEPTAADGSPATRVRRISEPKPNWTSAVPPARPRPGRSKPSPFPKTGSPWPRVTGHPSASTGPPPPPATCRSTSRTLSWSATAIASNSSSDRSVGILTYPVDDPTQSTQRNQILQPFFSAGLMGLQIVAWPYNLIMDPPWEAQYDLGYYRPGDNIPTDTYWLPSARLWPTAAREPGYLSRDWPKAARRRVDDDLKLQSTRTPRGSRTLHVVQRIHDRISRFAI